MTESRRYGLAAQLDIEQILLEAQHRWLRPAEICEILRNYTNFRIAPEPPHVPPSGSLFLFDRKVLRYFRKDGHSWRKKKDGKTVKEAHERLKAGSVDVLHCYYAHGEENQNFQRRCYWLLEEEHSNIVLVHYREVKGNRANLNRVTEVTEAVPNSQCSEVLLNSEVDYSGSSRFNPYKSYRVTSQNTDTGSIMSSQASEYEDVESAYNHSSSSGVNSLSESQSRIMEKTGGGLSSSVYQVPSSNNFGGKRASIPGTGFLPPAQTNIEHQPQKDFEFLPWEDDLGNSDSGFQSVPFQQTFVYNQPDSMRFSSVQEDELLGQALDQTNEWQLLYQNTTYPITSGAPRSGVRIPFTDTEEENMLQSESERPLITDKISDSSTLRQPMIGGLMMEGLKKLDSFDRWVIKELEDVNEPHIRHTSENYWDAVDAEDEANYSNIAPQERLDTYMLSPSLSQEQLFSIIDFSPHWAFAGSEIKVLITGTFLKSSQDVWKCNWSCMFGEIEVSAEIISDGVLRCHAPLHKPGRVPFYVTCANRLACSEVREFDYRLENIQDVDVPDIYCGTFDEVILRMRFAKLLCPESSESSPPTSSMPNDENSHLISKINLLLKDDDSEWGELLKLTSEEEFYPERVKEHLLQKLLKEKLQDWLVRKINEGGKGASVLDDEGQGVLHFAAALGYDWAISPTLVAGVSVNFRDVNGWTALHWAASCGREQTVCFLISRGAAPGALTDPTPLYHSGKTPADLASANGHKGIAGFLAESSLSDHLSVLQVNDGNPNERNERESTITRVSESSLKDSLAAVCNATQAAARIHQVFRAQSFQRKQIKEYGNDKKLELSDERALSLIAVKSRLGRDNEPVQTAAVRIQNKYRSYKGRKEYLTIRQHIVKIQAHVRGHQVRKSYGKIIWSVGIIDKVILRWRRKGSGLRGFKQEAIAQSSNQQINTSSKDDDDDFLKDGRRKTEERLQKALERVKSMVQYPDARDQYRRLLNVVTDMKENKEDDENYIRAVINSSHSVVACSSCEDLYDKVLNNTEEAADFVDDLIDIEALLGDDTYMTTSS